MHYWMKSKSQLGLNTLLFEYIQLYGKGLSINQLQLQSDKILFGRKGLNPLQKASFFAIVLNLKIDLFRY